MRFKSILIPLLILILVFGVSCGKKVAKAPVLPQESPTTTAVAQQPVVSQPEEESATPVKPEGATLRPEPAPAVWPYPNSDVEPFAIVYFDFDRYDLKPDAKNTLANVIPLLKNFPDKKVIVEGHCDERGTVEYNLALGERRAYSVKQYLVQAGIPESRIETISYGEERPVDPGHNEEAWAKNRRAAILTLK